ncbi:MAG: UDP-N-acetylmuramate--L-alanine ligase [Anaerolineae bacterium]|nr:UDP-N-acetylmuramate--L-alanine ligase [Anaerolineae bacterium]
MLSPGQRIHIIGVGGFGMSAIARVLLQQGYAVSGSDLRANDLTHSLVQAGAAVQQGHAAANVRGADLVIASSAVPDDNPEIVAARAAGMPVLRRRDILGELMALQTGIAIAGTHGKTTTTALMVHTLIEAGRDPTYIVGGVMQNTGDNAGVGQGGLFVIEADEYDHMFLGLRPRIAVVTNIEHDHPDCFPTLENLLADFRAFVALLPDDGLLVACADDPAASALGQDRRGAGKPGVSYGLDSPGADWRASGLEPDAAGGIRFCVAHADQPLGRVRLNQPGRHNVLNALAVLAVAGHLGVPFDRSAAAFDSFLGTQRRSEIMGQAGGVTVINDYAHHPTAIRVTLAAHRARPGLGDLWAVWQPHTYGRLRLLADAFAAAFEAADHVLITDVYSVREQHTPGLEAPDMADRIRANGHPDAQYSGSLAETARLLIERARPGDLIVLLSAGDAPRIGQDVLAALDGERDT